MDVENLADKIRLAKSGSSEAMMKIINIFLPIIHKYTQLLSYDEDCKSELVMKLISLVKNEIQLDKMSNACDGAIINYINFSLRHYYISLSVKQRQIKANEITYDHEALIAVLEEYYHISENPKDELLIDTIASVLTKKELFCVKSIIFDGYTAEQLAAYFQVSKQAINQCKNRALKKLRSIYS